MLSLNSRFGVVGEFRLNSDAVKVCAVGAGLHPQRGAEAGADKAFCEGTCRARNPRIVHPQCLPATRFGLETVDR